MDIEELSEGFQELRIEDRLLPMYYYLAEEEEEDLLHLPTGFEDFPNEVQGLFRCLSEIADNKKSIEISEVIRLRILQIRDEFLVLSNVKNDTFVAVASLPTILLEKDHKRLLYKLNSIEQRVIKNSNIISSDAYLFDIPFKRLLLLNTTLASWIYDYLRWYLFYMLELINRIYQNPINIAKIATTDTYVNEIKDLLSRGKLFTRMLNIYFARGRQIPMREIFTSLISGIMYNLNQEEVREAFENLVPNTPTVVTEEDKSLVDIAYNKAFNAATWLFKAVLPVITDPSGQSASETFNYIRADLLNINEREEWIFTMAYALILVLIISCIFVAGLSLFRYREVQNIKHQFALMSGNVRYPRYDVGGGGAVIYELDEDEE